MLQEVLDAGFRSVELGYDLTLDLVEGVQRCVKGGDIEVASVHNYCPVPMGAPMGHPELFDLSSPDHKMRASAVRHTTKTIEFAGGLGAKAVVLHCGYVDMTNFTAKLIELARNGKMYGNRFEKMKTKLILKRGKGADRRIDLLKRSLEDLLPEAEKNGVRICPENLPLWESVPSEMEMSQLIEEFNSPFLGYWHDIGHGQIRQDLGFTSQTTWVDRLKPAGFHIHDVDNDFHDHLMPARGKVDFSAFKEAANSGSLLVLEPSPGTPVEHLKDAAKHLEQCWEMEE